MCRRIGITTTIHKLRHYSATELILAGVDIRTVAGRLGHAGGGATTLRTYAAWVSEGDQRAAAHIAARMPKRPTSTRPEVVDVDVKNPYQRIAVDLRDQILVGTLIPGLPIPTIKQLAAAHGVSVPTAKRAVDLLAEWGFVEVISGRRTLVLKSAVDLGQAEATVGDNHPAEAPQASTATSDPKPLDLELRRLGSIVSRLRTTADPNDSQALHGLLLDAIRRDGREAKEIGDYELGVRIAGVPDIVTTYVAVAP
jgi:DNA-binding transcriptional regulator YhcF (GntR family)